MKPFARAYIFALLAFAIMDGVWLAVVASDFYAETLGYIMREQIIWASALVFYALYIAGVVHFASLPAARAGHWTKALFNGAFLGLVAYGTYDLTNHATLQGWPFIVVVVDMAWGASVTSVMAIAGFYGARGTVDTSQMEKAA